MSSLPLSVDREIERQIDAYVAMLRRILQMPSVAVRNEGLDECADHLADLLTQVGLNSSVLPTSVCPMVFAQSAPPDIARPTLLLTSHYDVQPPEPLEAWTYPPYEARQDGDRLVARGATDAKGNLIAIIAAIDAIRKSNGEFPVNIKVLFDGAEEEGSPQLDEFLSEHRELLNADAVVTFDAGFAPTDHPFIWLGSSGKLSVELRARGGNKDLHSSRSRLGAHPGWRLVAALNSIRGQDGKVHIDGFYDRVRTPNTEERAVLDDYPWDDQAYLYELGLIEFPNEVSGVRALEKLLFEPSCSITGLQSGYTGYGTKEVLPNSAVAKLEFRLVADQTADDVFEKLRRHIELCGFADIELVRHSWSNPTQAPLNSSIVRALVRAADDVYGKPVAIKPRHESSGRQAIWLSEVLDSTGAISGIGPPNWRGHAPDEFILIPYFLRGIKYIAATVFVFAELSDARR